LHAGKDSKGNEVLFAQKLETNWIYLLLPIASELLLEGWYPIFESAVDTELPWMKLRIIAINDADDDERLLYEEQLSFITAENFLTDYILGTSNGHILLGLPLSSQLLGVQVPSPFLHTFFPTVQDAYDALRVKK
jgi:hypothetical protein